MLFRSWEKGDDKIETCSIITTLADAFMKPIHDRMPVILSKDQEKRWLEAYELQEIESILKVKREYGLKAYEISRRVNSPSNEGPDILSPV